MSDDDIRDDAAPAAAVPRAAPAVAAGSEATSASTAGAVPAAAPGAPASGQAAAPATHDTPADPSSPVALLHALARALPPEAIDELWIFPARRVGSAQSTVIVASAFEPQSGSTAGAEGAPPAAGAPEEAAPDRRRIITARFTLGGEPRARELRHELAEHGAAPSERVGRVVDGVLRRLDDEPAPPRHARIGGDTARWLELLDRLARDQ